MPAVLLGEMTAIASPAPRAAGTPGTSDTAMHASAETTASAREAMVMYSFRFTAGSTP
jgi:hypothetical protein